MCSFSDKNPDSSISLYATDEVRGEGDNVTFEFKVSDGAKVDGWHRENPSRIVLLCVHRSNSMPCHRDPMMTNERFHFERTNTGKFIFSIADLKMTDAGQYAFRLKGNRRFNFQLIIIGEYTCIVYCLMIQFICQNYVILTYVEM